MADMPKAVNVGTGAGAVALEIALQFFAALRDGQFVVGTGEVVHADIDVAIVLREAFDDVLEQLQFDLGRRAGFFAREFSAPA